MEVFLNLMVQVLYEYVLKYHSENHDMDKTIHHNHQHQKLVHNPNECKYLIVSKERKKKEEKVSHPVFLKGAKAVTYLELLTILDQLHDLYRLVDLLRMTFPLHLP
jgi:biopolymer transport protein ExbD